ncbi:hypothetical protein IWX49DRAFT_337614 [Phyllosticta citricarpa]|uniref:Uncharacterized protein n=2 Tax=Phyllosticta TaxID=121621 RepID=A0ABR1MDB3_9PEZI
MFCSSLRRRPSTASVIPIVTAANGLRLSENALETHDLAVPLPSQQDHLLVLLLSPQSVATDRLPSTLERVHRFSTLKGGAHSVILFLVHPFESQRQSIELTTERITVVRPSSCPGSHSGMNAYHRLKGALDDSSSSTPPILPVPAISGLESVLKSYMRHLENPQPTLQPSRPLSDAALDILPHCTAGIGPLPRDAVIALTDMFPSLKGIATAATADPNDAACREAWAKMVEEMGEENAQNTIDFWRTEWVAE